MMPVTRKQQYDTHFYCALCGGPFAQVFRTPVNPAYPRFYSEASSIDQDAADPDDGADLDPCNAFNFDAEENRVIPEEVVEQDMGYAARRSRKLRIRAEEEGRRKGVISEKRTARQAYDGRRISVKQMKWTNNLRALICSKATSQPLNWEHYVQSNEQIAYLTGRGLIRQSNNWADAFASVDEDEAADGDGSAETVHTEYPVFSESAKQGNTYGFHVYQELGGHHVRSLISSIPFHDECWTLLDMAIEETGNEKGLEHMNEELDLDHMWGHLRGLISVCGQKQQAEQTWAILQEGKRKDVVTRLGEVDYREAQGCGEGWHWRHDDGCHWLAADPSLISVRDDPLKLLPNTDPFPVAPRSAITDPFMSLPHEVILEVVRYLPSPDIFCLKISSPAVLHVVLPESYYRRFLRQEFKYLPKLGLEIDKHERGMRKGVTCPIDWRGSFERLRRLIRTPRPSMDLNDDDDDDDDCGKEWDEIDIGLKNRSRIWKIVKPIAEALVETSSTAFRVLHRAHGHAVEQTNVVRGYVGVRSQQYGAVETAYIGSRGRPTEMGFEEVRVKVKKIRFWYDSQTRIFCGLEFYIDDEEFGADRRRFGRQGSAHVDFAARTKILAGFAFCFADGIICGAQVFYLAEDEAHHPKPTLEFSKRIGKWDDGIVRKVIVPLSWRKFVGLTGFVNSAGFIETIGILEETHDVQATEDEFGPLNRPPRTIPLTHDEASLWKGKLPPSSVVLREREGAEIADWRVSGSEWEIWESNIHEDGVKTSWVPWRRLKRITGYYDEWFLRGLEFVYVGRSRQREHATLMGVKEGNKTGSINFSEGENVIASVICFGDEGIHGILFVTDRAQVSEVFGPRYRGTHKVFAPLPDHSRSSGTAYREEISNKIIGVHGLYDYEDKRFLQLGLILPIEEGFQVFKQQVPCTIPFDETNEQLAVWDDGPPPADWIIGKSPTFVEVDTSFRSRQFPPFNNDYSGWAKLYTLRQIVIYRHMRGIKFSYDKDKVRFFGFVDDEEDAVIQNIDFEAGERVIGIAVLENEEREITKAASDGDCDVASITSASSRADFDPMERLYFITNFNEREISLLPVKCNFQSPEHLVAVKFDFNFDQLVSWAPIFATETSVPGVQSLYSRGELIKLTRLPWKARREKIYEDRNIPDQSSYVASAFFEENGTGIIDGVKGYVTRMGRFCGLLFRRNGKWSKEAFGERSAYEIVFLLHENEYFDSIFLPEDPGTGRLGAYAIALSTNHGRTTPWIGMTKPDVIANHRKAPEGFVGIGFFGAQEKKPDIYAKVRWEHLGLLYCNSEPGYVPSSPTRQPLKPRASTYHQLDKPTGLCWLNDVSNWIGKLRLTRLLDEHPRAIYRHRKPEDVGRAFSVFDPAKLLQIRVWCSRTAICSIRFRGTQDMGVVTVGDWPDSEDTKLRSDQKMRINGPAGERILRIKVAFQRLETEDRIIGMTIETSYGRAKTIVSPEMCPERPIDLTNENVKILECRERDEIVGLHGIFGMYIVHDIGLVLKDKMEETKAGD